MLYSSIEYSVNLFSLLVQSICSHLLPALFGKCTFSDTERQLISLPSRLGGLIGIINPFILRLSV